MASRRKVRRIAGFVACYFSDDLLLRVEDPRSERGRRWKSCLPLLKALLLGIAAGCTGLTAVEEMTAELPKSLRKLLGIATRIPDTTLRDFACKLLPEQLSNLLYVVGYDAWRRKALQPLEGFPFGVLSLDGKYPSVTDTGDYKYLQVHHDETGVATHGLVRTVTCALVTALGRPVLGAVPVPGDTNEQGSFHKAFGDMVRIFGRLFRMVMYDAGAASETNAQAVLRTGKHYFFQIADPRWVMHQMVELLFQGKAATVRDEEGVSSRKRVMRELTLLPVTQTRKNLTIWEHAKTIFKVYSETYEGGVLTSTRTRYYISSMDSSEMSAEKWLALIVLRWGVETVHQILDTAFAEDPHPWISADAQGALAVMLLRRVAYTLLTLYESVTLRSEENRRLPWRKLMEWVKDLLKWPNPEEFLGLRTRTFAVPPVFA